MYLVLIKSRVWVPGDERSRGALFAVVIDSYDPFNAIKIMHEGGLFERVAQSGATMVLRPDSGNPLTMPRDILNYLCKLVGYTSNEKGFDVLPSHLRVIQGDGITIDSIPKICDNLIQSGLSMDNLAFGMGGGLLQQCNRDTFGFAMKCSQIEVSGITRDVFKETPGKESKRGDFDVFRNPDGTLVTDKRGTGHKKVNHTVYSHNGNYTLSVPTDFAKVRENAAL